MSNKSQALTDIIQTIKTVRLTEKEIAAVTALVQQIISNRPKP